MDSFFKKYVDKKMCKTLIKTGVNPSLLHTYRHAMSIPKPNILYKICWVIAVELQLDIGDVVFDAVNFITGDKK